jgi:twitching motility protein PilT
MSIDELLRAAGECEASDLHLKAGTVPHVRINGELRPLPGSSRLSAEDIEKIASTLLNNRQRDRLEEGRAVDLAYGVQGLGRFRVNMFRQRGSIALALRLVPNLVYTFEQLHLPPVVARLADERRGLVLVTGITGCGKSTTLATMVDSINSTQPVHIITIEDPIEFLHRDKMGFVDQREVGVDTPDFGSALRSALRQDPDVILVGEMRDAETIQTALLAAETGHLVFSTLHTLDATETIQRMIAVFPLRDQQQIRLQVASTLRGVIGQRLLRRKDGTGRVPAVEVLVATDYIRDCIVRPEKTHLISQALAAGASQYGMQTFDQSLLCLYAQGLISLEEALRHASRPDDLKLRIAGIRSGPEVTPEENERPVPVDRFG